MVINNQATDMIKSYRLKAYPNTKKLGELNKLISFWRDQVNHKIKIFWGFAEIKGSYPPKENTVGGRLIRDASVKAWQVVKGARETDQIKRPVFEGNEIDLNEFSGYIIPDFQTVGFDLWFNIISLNKHKRLKVPCKKTNIFNEAIKQGRLGKSFKIEKINNEYYITCFVEIPEIEKSSDKVVGIDVGLNSAIATSDGRILGRDLKDLRTRTRWRNYKGKQTPSKQKLNYYAKELVKAYPDTNFAVENLLFKGRRNRSKTFRRRHNIWAYNHLANRLYEIGHLEGFRVLKVCPAFSSQKCPECGYTDRANRQYEHFTCGQCGYKGNSDIVGAMNIAERVVREHSVLSTRGVS